MSRSLWRRQLRAGIGTVLGRANPTASASALSLAAEAAAGKRDFRTMACGMKGIWGNLRKKIKLVYANIKYFTKSICMINKNLLTL